ncbi:hypothetical protein HGO38_11285 [Rhizobium sp. CG5]|uniref:hypothetical protein n=1 Tax=Rhizobium sp. CG5 TaxID=2726076 RepID=UPI0020331E33|nr:hypothetical protein [Rhizobium sp. CG5]MCM2474055.1 hypothetical protein [Rhizobium sp. CG5]
MALVRLRIRSAKITAAALTAASLLVALCPLVAELTLSRFLGLLTGANFLAMQLGILWSLRKSIPSDRMLQTCPVRRAS